MFVLYFHSCWSTWVKGRASWMLAWLRPVGLSTHASTTMNWRSQMLERSVISPWGWHAGWEAPHFHHIITCQFRWPWYLLYTLCCYLSGKKSSFPPLKPRHRTHMHHCSHCFQSEWWMIERGKANNRINIVSFHPHIWFSIESRFFHLDANLPCTRVLQSRVWKVTYEIRSDASFVYVFSVSACHFLFPCCHDMSKICN